LKRLFDIFFSFFGLVLLIPLFIVIALLIAIDSRGGVFYKQSRVGKNNVDFNLLKFRSMKTGADKNGLLTVGGKDSRITKIGYFIRKYKIDELPQLINVLSGTMSLVGPRPEVRKYVDLYNDNQKQVLNVKPGLTDFASIVFSKENDLLAAAENPEEVYINKIMPLKLKLNLKYIEEQSISTDLKIIFKTLGKILK
jgi:lipopolysaccharide/colanic/teichoic acid biosynthesis glycosyltransferase